MGFFGDLWKGVKSTASSAYRIGKKAVGTVASVGRKAIDVGRHVVGQVEKIPVIGDVLAPATAMARGALGAAEGVVGAAERAQGYMKAGEGLVGQAQKVLGGAREMGRGVRQVMRTGDLQQAADVVRRGQDLYGEGTRLGAAAAGAARGIQKQESKLAQAKGVW